MFCSECGVKATGKFCFQCGSRLHPPHLSGSDAAPPEPLEFLDDVADHGIDWEHDPRYHVVVSVSAVRRVIARHAAAATKGLSGEQLLAISDKVVSSPIPLEGLVSVVQPLYASWGMKTGKHRSAVIGVPVGRAIARTLCSLARHGQTFTGAQQGESGCVLTAELPSSPTALKGEIKVGLVKRPDGTQVTAATNIPGQLFDWGKSTRCLDRLLTDLHQDLGLPRGNPQRHVA